MSVHFCPLDRGCRQLAAETGGATMAWRIELTTRRHTFGVALRPGDRYVDGNVNDDPGSWRYRWLHVRPTASQAS